MCKSSFFNDKFLNRAPIYMENLQFHCAGWLVLETGKVVFILSFETN